MFPRAHSTCWITAFSRMSMWLLKSYSFHSCWKLNNATEVLFCCTALWRRFIKIPCRNYLSVYVETCSHVCSRCWWRDVSPISILVSRLPRSCATITHHITKLCNHFTIILDTFVIVLPLRSHVSVHIRSCEPVVKCVCQVLLANRHCVCMKNIACKYYSCVIERKEQAQYRGAMSCEPLVFENQSIKILIRRSLAALLLARGTLATWIISNNTHP